MKSLLMTTAAALTVTISAAGAFADHDSHTTFSRNSAAYRNGYSYGFNNSQYTPVVPRYSPLNSGWSVGQFNPGWNSGLGSSCRAGNGYPTQPGYPLTQQPSFAPGGCYRVGGQTICPSSGRFRVYQPYGQFNNGFGNGFGPLR